MGRSPRSPRRIGERSGLPPPPHRAECALTWQVNENARKDLKEGLLLYNSENNVGLKNAWNIIQAEVRSGLGRCAQMAWPGRWAGLGLRLSLGTRLGTVFSGSDTVPWAAAEGQAGPGCGRAGGRHGAQGLGRKDDPEGTPPPPFPSEALARMTEFILATGLPP